MCVASFMSATAAPAASITMGAGAAPCPDRDKYPVVFEIDMLKCIYCGMCEEACPCDAIELTETFTQVATTRAEKVYDKERLLRN
jgi:NADH-quinone oxidoreductase subunit I